MRHLFGIVEAYGVALGDVVGVDVVILANRACS